MTTKVYTPSRLHGLTDQNNTIQTLRISHNLFCLIYSKRRLSSQIF